MQMMYWLLALVNYVEKYLIIKINFHDSIDAGFKIKHT